MKKVLGLDLGTCSIGWAVVNQAVDHNEESSIVKLGVRVNPLQLMKKAILSKGKVLPPQPTARSREVCAAIYNATSCVVKIF